MIISFAWTTSAFMAKRKTCTRRDWDDNYALRWKKDSVHQAVNRQLRYGGKFIGKIRLTETPYKELTSNAPLSDYYAEGFDYLQLNGHKVNGMTPNELWVEWQCLNPVELWVVRFEILEVYSDNDSTALIES